MPRLENDRHEAFAQAIVRGASQTDAYVEAGFAHNRHNASRLITNETIQARIAELQERAAANVVITKEWVIEQLVDNARKAKEQGDFGPSNRALELIGRETGMFVERVENTNLNYTISDEPMTADEWAQEHATTTH